MGCTISKQHIAKPEAKIVYILNYLQTRGLSRIFVSEGKLIKGKQAGEGVGEVE